MKHVMHTCALALAALLAGCASEPMVMRLDAPAAGSGLYPSPQTQEVPRYRYLGQLTGEGNFRPRDGASRSPGRRLLALIAGLDERPDQPVVLQRPQTGMVDGNGRVLVTDVSRNAVFVFDEPAGKLDVWERAALGLVEHEHRVAAHVRHQHAAIAVDHAGLRPLQHHRLVRAFVQAGDQRQQPPPRAAARAVPGPEIAFARELAEVAVARHFLRLRRGVQAAARRRRVQPHRHGLAGGLRQQRGERECAGTHLSLIHI